MIDDNKNLENALLQGRRYNFFMVGNDIADTEELNIYEKAICYQIARYSNNGNVAFPSYNTLAKKCGMSRRKAIDTVKDLVEKNILIKVTRLGNAETAERNESNLYALNDNLYRFLEGSASHALGGSASHALGVVHHMHPINNNNINNNIYGAEDTNKHSVATLPKEDDNRNIHSKKKNNKKKEVIKVSEDSVYCKVMKHFNSIEKTNYKANTKEYIKNIDMLVETYTIEDIINVIDYVRECNYNEEYWRPSTIFRVSNFERSYEFCQKWLKTKKTCANNHTQVSSTTTKTYYIINPNTNTVMSTPVKPNGTYFLSKEEAEAAIK